MKSSSRLIFIGTAGSVAGPERDNTSFLLRKEGTSLLVDCPGGVFQKLLKAGCPPKEVEALLVTHIHPDHIYGLPSLVHSLMTDEGCLRIFGSGESISLCRKLLDLFRLRRKKVKYEIDFFPLRPEESFSVGPFRCRTQAVPHHSSSLAYSFQTPEGVHLYYSADTPVYPPLFKENPGIDFLVHDCSAPSRFFEQDLSLYEMHTHSRELGLWSSRAGVKTLIPCHFFVNLGFDISEIEKEIRENFKGDLIIPMDFQTIELKSDSVREEDERKGLYEHKKG